MLRRTSFFLSSLIGCLSLGANACVEPVDTTGAGGGGVGGAGGGTPSGVYGTVTYEYVPYDRVNNGLNYAAIEARPVRGARVVLLKDIDATELGQAVTGEDGTYQIPYEAPDFVRVRVLAASTVPDITVEDNTAGDAVYAVESLPKDPAIQAPLDVLARTGWTGAAYTEPRASAPFAILDAVRHAATRIQNEVIPAPVLPPLKVNWSINNVPQNGDPVQGKIGLTHWDGQEIYVTGKADVDCDEFDSHVIVHEYGHYLQTHLSRSDSFGGNHYYGERLDPRLAFGEGFCNAWSAVALDPDTGYTDASGPGQQDGFWYDLEANDNSTFAVPGWFSETTVEGVVFDLYDPANEPFDNVTLSFSDWFNAFIAHKDTPAFTTLFSFLTTVKLLHPEAAGAVDALADAQDLNSTYGLDAVEDEWGTGESHGGGYTGTLPVYNTPAPGETITVTLRGSPYQDSTLDLNRYVRVTGKGKPVTITVSSANDVDMYVFQAGKIVAVSDNPDGNEKVTLSGKSGDEYTINLISFHEGQMDFPVSVSLSPKPTAPFAIDAVRVGSGAQDAEGDPNPQLLSQGDRLRMSLRATSRVTDVEVAIWGVDGGRVAGDSLRWTEALRERDERTDIDIPILSEGTVAVRVTATVGDRRLHAIRTFSTRVGASTAALPAPGCLAQDESGRWMRVFSGDPAKEQACSH